MKFTEEHEWLREEDGLIVVGITEHAATQLGDIVFVELPDVGTTVTKDEEVVVIESVKAASDILAPIDGEIVEVNDAAHRCARDRERRRHGQRLDVQDQAVRSVPNGRIHGRSRLQKTSRIKDRANALCTYILSAL